MPGLGLGGISSGSSILRSFIVCAGFFALTFSSFSLVCKVVVFD